MGARENILARIRSAQGRAGAMPTAEELALVRAHIARREVGPQPSAARSADPLAQFRSECARLGSTFARMDSIDALPAEVARYLADNGLEKQVVLWEEFAALGWAQAGVAIAARPAGKDDRTGLTGSYCAIAETATILLLSAPEWPRTTALLPETHIAVVRMSRLVSTMEAAFALLRAEKGELARAAWFISGPSRTADIEQTLVIGAHGPYRVHVIVVP